MAKGDFMAFDEVTNPVECERAEVSSVFSSPNLYPLNVDFD